MGGQSDDNCEKPKPSGNSITDFKLHNVALGLFKAIDGPVTYFREKVVEPLQAKSTAKWYHRRFNRVPTIDQCEVDDVVCIYEADQQFFRDRHVDSNIVKILRQRKLECIAWEGPDCRYKCRDIEEEYERAATNWFIKYGEIRYHRGSLDAFMKQKQRLIWERRNPDKKLY